ncbi:MAG: molybdopterin-dependent oxidoreductase [Nitrospirae bacterium]|nr:molybdopterin-dependent oxidoreductase [Nitrospirota bacterium]
MKTINVVINGIPVQLERPMNIVEAAKRVGIHVPHFCYHKELTIYAGCRICMVEVKGKPRPVAGCSTIMSDGMEVFTESEKVIAARKGVLELQLLHHPLDCPVCDKGGECALQDYAFKYGAAQTRFIENKRLIPVNYNNPLLERNMERCVSCKRCVRICAEIQGDWVLSDMNRGSRVTMESFCGDESECVHCGHCLSNCPVGAIQSRLYKHVGRPWYVDTEAETICPYCADGCTMTLQTREDKVLRVVSDETYSKGANRGSLCVRGRFGYDFPNSNERLTTPLVKKDGYFVESNWDEAVAHVAKRLSEIKSAAGPDAIGAVIGGRNTNEEAYLLQKFMRTAVGTNNIDNMARMGHINALNALEAAFGVAGSTNQIKDIAQAKAVLLIGNDAATENPITGLAIKKAVLKGGAKLIVADAGRNMMTKHSSQRLTYRAGSEGELVMGLINAVFATNMHDADLEAKNTSVFDKVRAKAGKYTPAYVSEKTGIPAEDIKRAATVFANAKPATIVFGKGITATADGFGKSLALADLAFITGNVGKPGGGINPMASKAGEQGACDVGALPDRLPGYRKVSSAEDRKRLGGLWKSELPENPGMTVGEMVEAAGAGKLQAMYVVGANLAYELPDTKNTVEYLKKLKFLVVHDIFMSETAQLADVVFPAATFAEKSGTFTNSERRVQRIAPAMKLQGGARPDGEIIAAVSAKMGRPMDWEPAVVMEKISVSTPIYAGITYDTLAGGGVQWPYYEEMKSGTAVLHAEGVTGRADNTDAGVGEGAALAGKVFPFVADITVSLYHSGTTTRRTRGPNMVVGKALAGMNPSDASGLGIADGDTVVVRSSTGELRLPASIDKAVPSGVVHIPAHFADVCAGTITGLVLDPAGKTPVARYWPVAVTKA